MSESRTEKDTTVSEGMSPMPSGRRASAKYFMLSLAWTSLVAIGWTLYFLSLPTQEEQAYARWVSALEAFDTLTPYADRPVALSSPINAERLMDHVQSLSIERASEKGRNQARAYLRETLINQGWSVKTHTFPGGTNLWVEKRGQMPQAGLMVVAAHYDGPANSPGADDNASGLAVLLELARVSRDWTHPLGLRLVFFDCEETGLLGARAYLADGERRAGIHFALILEMLGFKCDQPGCQRALPGLPQRKKGTGTHGFGDFLAAVGNLEEPALLTALKRAERPEGPSILAIPISKENRQRFQHSRRSDHAAFWDLDIPAVMLTDTANFRNPNYHDEKDTPETLDLDFLTGGALTIRDAVYVLLQAPAIKADTIAGPEKQDP